MGYTINFTDNQMVDSASLNAVAGDIEESAKGFNEFTDGVLYGADSLNSITKALITKGVSYGCDVTKTGENIFISQGVLFFADGKKMTIDADGITLSYPQNTACYVYALNDEVHGVVSAKCTQDAPVGDYVMLAELAQSGVLYLKKDIARMKNSSLLPNSYIERTISFSKNVGEKICTFDLGGNYRRMLFISERKMVFIDWDKNKWIEDKTRYVEEYDMTEDSLPILSCDPDALLRIISFENNILTYEVTAHYGGGEFILKAM